MVTAAETFSVPTAEAVLRSNAFVNALMKHLEQRADTLTSLRNAMTKKYTIL
jgi:hypothetical protein